MNSKLRVVISVVTTICMLLFMWYLSTIIVYIVVSLIISLIGAPLVNKIRSVKIKNWQIPHSLAAAITLFVIVGAVISAISVITPMLTKEAESLSHIKVSQVEKSLEVPLLWIEDELRSLNVMSSPHLPYKTFVQEKLTGVMSISNVTSVFSNIFGMLGNVLIAFFSIAFISFFFLKDPKLISNFIVSLTSKSNSEKILNIMSSTKTMLSRYFIGISIQVGTIALLISVGMLFLDIRTAILIGVFAGVINIIPYVGPLFGYSVGIILTVTSHLELDFVNELLPLLGKVSILFLVVQLLDNFVFQPIIFSNSVNAHPLEIFLVILAAGTIGGITGMIVAIPLYTLIRIIAKEFLSGFKLVETITKNL